MIVDDVSYRSIDYIHSFFFLDCLIFFLRTGLLIFETKDDGNFTKKILIFFVKTRLNPPENPTPVSPETRLNRVEYWAEMGHYMTPASWAGLGFWARTRPNPPVVHP